MLLAATLAVGATMAGIGPIAEALGVAAARFWSFAYAQARGIGSLGFLVANLVVGALIAAHRLLDRALVDRRLPGRRSPCSRSAIPARARSRARSRPTCGEIGRLMLNPVFALFMAAVAFTQASHAVMYALGIAALARARPRRGARSARSGPPSVATEIVFMVPFGAWRSRSGSGRSGRWRSRALAGIVRWGAMMADPTGFWLWPIQGAARADLRDGASRRRSRSSPAPCPSATPPPPRAPPARWRSAAVMALAMALAAAVYPALGGRTYGIGVALSRARPRLWLRAGGRGAGGLMRAGRLIAVVDLIEALTTLAWPDSA